MMVATRVDLLVDLKAAAVVAQMADLMACARVVLLACAKVELTAVMWEFWLASEKVEMLVDSSVFVMAVDLVVRLAEH